MMSLGGCKGVAECLPNSEGPGTLNVASLQGMSKRHHKPGRPVAVPKYMLLLADSTPAVAVQPPCMLIHRESGLFVASSTDYL